MHLFLVLRAILLKIVMGLPYWSKFWRTFVWTAFILDGPIYEIQGSEFHIRAVQIRANKVSIRYTVGPRLFAVFGRKHFSVKIRE